MSEKSRLLLFCGCNGSMCEYGFLYQFCNVKICLYLSVFYTFLRIWCMGMGQGKLWIELKIQHFSFYKPPSIFFFINYGRLRRKEQRCTCSVDDTCRPRQDQRHPFQGSHSSGEENGSCTPARLTRTCTACQLHAHREHGDLGLVERHPIKLMLLI